MIHQLFQELSPETKVNFFVNCQELLVTHHPKSPFVFRKDNLIERKAHISELAGMYKGYCFFNDKVSLLYNLIELENPTKPALALQQFKFQPPSTKYNALSIDFVVFRQLRDCFDWCRQAYEPRIQYVLFVKNGKIQVSTPKALLSKLFHIPVAEPAPLP